MDRFDSKGEAINSIIATGYTGGTTNTADAIRRMKDEMFSGSLGTADKCVIIEIKIRLKSTATNVSIK